MTGYLLLDLAVIWGGLFALCLLVFMQGAQIAEDYREDRQEREARADLYPHLRLIDCSPVDPPYDHENAPTPLSRLGA